MVMKKFGMADDKGPALPEDTVELAVGQDRMYLALTGAGFLLLTFAGLVLVAGGIGAAQLSGSVAYLALAIVGLPVAWFASKAMGARFGRLASGVDAIDFGERYVFVHEKADASKALVLSYRDIAGYRIIRQGSALRLLLAGPWVTHPSGFYLVNINRPFAADGLGELEGQIRAVMAAHRVKERS